MVYDVTKYLNDHPGGPEIMMEFAGAFIQTFITDTRLPKAVCIEIEITAAKVILVLESRVQETWLLRFGAVLSICDITKSSRMHD